MDYLNNWVKNIVFLLLLITFLLIFLPGGKLKKYVRVIFGFFVILVFISPLANLFGGGGTVLFERIIHREDIADWSQIEAGGEQLLEQQDSTAGEYYEKELAEELERILDLNFPDREQSVEVSMDEYFNLEQIKVTSFSRENELEITPIEIEIDESEEKSEEIYREEKLRIENKISNILQIPPETVEVIIRD